MSTLYATDLDGTLLNNESIVSPRSVKMLNEAIGRGVLFTVATARTPATVSGLLKDINLKLPLVVMTGAAIWDPVTDRYLDTCFHRDEDVRHLVEIYRCHSLSTFIYTLRDHKIHIYHIGPLNEVERRFIAERDKNPYKTFHIPPSGESLLPKRLDNVLLMFALQPTEQAAVAYPEVRRMESINSVFYPDLFNPGVSFIEAFPKEATKAMGLVKLRNLSGADRLVVFGDNVNDLPMFAVADEGIAVANAVETLKLKATTVTGPNTDDSVAREIIGRIDRQTS